MEQRLPTAETIPFAGEEAARPAGEQIAGLKERLDRLEDAIAVLQDTRALEDRVTERLTERARQSETSATVARSAAAVGGTRRALPVFGVVRPDDAPSGAPAAIPIGPAARSPWFFFEVLREMRAILRMYFDRHYRLTWAARLVPLAALVLGLLSYFLLAGRLWILGDVVDKVIDLCLVVLVWKVLCREATRYQAALAPPQTTAGP